MIDYKAVSERRWTSVLSQLEGSETIRFASLPEMLSCRSMAYFLNTNNEGRYYSIKMDKDTLTLTITVSDRRRAR